MELKAYQRVVLDDIEAYLAALERTGGLHAAWKDYWDGKGFCINGWRNHYPDFMVMTERGTLVIVEVKGPQLDGTDSQEKCEMGKIWATQAGQNYEYFMVFLKDGDGVAGGTKIDEFLNTLEKL